MSFNKLKYCLFIFFAVSVAFTVSCTFEKVEPEICKTALPDTVSFQKDIIPIFEKECSISGCHSGRAPAGKLNLSSEAAYTNLSKKGSGYIDTLNPSGSVLYTSVISNSIPMPPSGHLNDCSIKLIYKWMEQKGKNN